MEKQGSRRVLIMGPPASGKSYLVEYFKSRGKDAYDGDNFAHWIDESGNAKELTRAEWKNPIGMKWVWNVAKLKTLINEHKELYFFGSAYNEYDVMHMFDDVYYLKADESLLNSRFENRKSSEQGFGKTSTQRKIIFEWLKGSDKKAEERNLKMIDASLQPKEIYEIICSKTKTKTPNKSLR